jgi:hypothetical protein
MPWLGVAMMPPPARSVQQNTAAQHDNGGDDQAGHHASRVRRDLFYHVINLLRCEALLLGKVLTLLPYHNKCILLGHDLTHHKKKETTNQKNVAEDSHGAVTPNMYYAAFSPYIVGLKLRGFGRF